MKPYFETELGKLYHGDCLNVMAAMPNNSVDTIITDPPYGLSFMGKKWDYDVPSVEIWEECLGYKKLIRKLGMHPEYCKKCTQELALHSIRIKV